MGWLYWYDTYATGILGLDVLEMWKASPRITKVDFLKSDRLRG